jgi:transposase InsO family protein
MSGHILYTLVDAMEADECADGAGEVRARAGVRVFREFGLPAAIRSDNGPPFACTGIHGLCALNVWWMKLGIVHQRITPSSPQENGAHERMQRTLKARATRERSGKIPRASFRSDEC